MFKVVIFCYITRKKHSTVHIKMRVCHVFFWETSAQKRMIHTNAKKYSTFSAYL